jgi:hypothetical protein
MQQTTTQHGTIIRLGHLSTKAATAIQKSLDEYKVAQRGFVMFRCTYSSQDSGVD